MPVRRSSAVPLKNTHQGQHCLSFGPWRSSLSAVARGRYQEPRCFLKSLLAGRQRERAHLCGNSANHPSITASPTTHSGRGQPTLITDCPSGVYCVPVSHPEAFQTHSPGRAKGERHGQAGRWMDALYIISFNEGLGRIGTCQTSSLIIEGLLPIGHIACHQPSSTLPLSLAQPSPSL